MSKRLYIFDVDGTLVRSFMRERSGGGPIDGSAADVYDRVEVLPRRMPYLRRLALSEDSCFALATNQAGASLGYQTREQVEAKMGAVCAALHHFWGCPHSVHIAFEHPKAKDPALREDPDRRRKPGPGLLHEALRAHGIFCAYGRSVFVGDMETDRGAAQAAGVPYLDADDFFPVPSLAPRQED